MTGRPCPLDPTKFLFFLVMVCLGCLFMCRKAAVLERDNIRAEEAAVRDRR
jgi:hypothetical protein